MEKSNKTAYQSTVENVLHSYEVTLEGLSKAQVKINLQKYGYNVLAEKKSTHPFLLFVNQFSNPLVLLLIIAAIISLVLHEFIDAGFIGTIVLINAVIGFIQEYKAENTIKALKKLLSPKASVVRDGKQQEIDSKDLVPGDIVHLTAGNAVPADIRLLEEQNLRIDESTLTGESVPVNKNAHVISEETQVADQHNMMFMGTTVVGGKAIGVVVSTGNQTSLGSIASETSDTQREKSPLTQKFAQFAQIIGIITVISASIIAITQLIAGEPITEVFKVVVGIAVATIPEGLPIIVTIALSIAVQRMGKHKAIIRQLPAAETLGSTTVICTDKTGTLTMNQMNVFKLYDGREEYEPNVQYDPKKKKLADLLRCGVLCTELPEIHKNKDVVTQADPTEMAIVLASQKTGIMDDLSSWKYLDTLPFQNEKRLMATMVQQNHDNLLMIKGSPEKILALCGEQTNKQLLDKIEEFAKNGLRVIACAEKKLHSDTTITDEHLHSGFNFLGFFALMDPPRADVKEAIDLCKQAGIRVVMITGDHPTTAAAIAKQLNIAAPDQKVITGEEILHMSEKDLVKTLSNVTVFARVTPDQKLRIVNAYKAAGEIVAVTGDGVNDAPALKSAHIGVAMGQKGTDVAKEAAGMVILDDSFSTIVKAVREARTLFENIRKATFFLVPSGFSVILTIVVSLFLGYPMPYTAIQLLWVNLVTNGLQDISLAFEPEEKNNIAKPPRKPTEGIMSGLLYRRSILVAIVITIGVIIMYTRAIEAGVSLMEAQTIALSTMIIFQFMQLFNSRSETLSIFKQPFFSNKLLIISMILAVSAYILTITFPPLQWLLGTTTIPVITLIEIMLIACTVIVVIEIDKAITRKIQHNYSP